MDFITSMDLLMIMYSLMKNLNWTAIFGGFRDDQIN